MTVTGPYETTATAWTQKLLSIQQQVRDRAEALTGEPVPEDVEIVDSFSTYGGDRSTVTPELFEAPFAEGGPLEEIDPELLAEPQDPDAAINQTAVDTIRGFSDEISADDAALAAVVDAGGDVSADRFFKTNAPGNREAEYNITVYESDAKDSPLGEVIFEDRADVDPFLTALGDLPAAVEPADIIDGSDAIEQAYQESDARRQNREAARDAAEAAGVDLDEFGIDATAEGDVIVQDRDTGQTRNIDADAPGGVGSAIDAATGDGQFVADDADPAASGSGSGDGLGARAAGAVVLLFAAIAAALGWLS